MNRSAYASEFNKMPVWFKAINRVWKLSGPSRSGIPINKDDLIRSARKETGLQDLGNDFWDEPLDKLIHSINTEANLHPIGRFITKKRLVNLLASRLYAEWWFKKEPGILDQELYPVLMIAGLQRTGTTKLQRLISADPETRSLLSWEALNPAPPVNGPDKRVRFAKTSETALKYMAPGFFAIHPVEHTAEEEDIMLLDVSFMSTTAEATMHVPAYAAWLEKTDQAPAYAYGAKLLKLLQWQRPGKRWVLKSPHHLEFFDLINAHYGDVYYLWTHRDLTKCIPSFLSMVGHGQCMFSDAVDIGRITAHWMKKTRYMLQQAMSFRSSFPEKDRFIDIPYGRFVERPMDTVRSVYQRAGIPLGPEIESIIQATEKRNYKGKYGTHHYRLQDFGLEKATINTHYKDYIRFMEDLKIH